MGRYKSIDENGIYFTTHTIVEWMPVFKERKYFEIIIASFRFCMRNKGLHVFGYVIMLYGELNSQFNLFRRGLLDRTLMGV